MADNPFDNVDAHDDYDPDDDQIDNSENPDPSELPAIRRTDEPELDAAP